MTPPSLPPSGFQFVRTALLCLWLLRGVHYGTGLEIDTPQNLTECETTKLIWSGGHPPFTLQILYQNNSLVQEFNNINNNFLFWTANVTAGTGLSLELFDSSNSTGPAFSGTFSVQSGNDTTCLQSSSTTSPVYSTGTASSSSTSPSATSSIPSPTEAGVSGPPSRLSKNALSTGAIASIAVASLVAGLLIALGVWLIRRRRKSSSRPRIPNQQQLDTYRYSGPPKSDDGWSVTTPRDPEDDLRSQPDEAKAGLSWDPRLFAQETTPSPSPPMEHPVVTRQVVYPGIARPLSSYPPLIPTPSPIPMSARESGMWVDSGSGTTLSRSSTNPFRARLLAAAASSETTQAGVNGSIW
ncbi:hypothetical protein GSI_08549 [Ganoderma sinense ZZ0214-1]|uniref:Mid2 domain-containing protein n=1 Tax=Ganoderma sinense ZZ0214-1 TaxID=1077348 RepID=A0A2G8S422_9APHY|nr:hypothetical protein GSI_08549 [Ganoderma sinense ZZ0214-1]